MPVFARRFAPTLLVLAVALLVWLPTIGWGLPSRDSDKYLFGERRPWTGAEIVALTATTQPTTARGADVDADPILDRSKPVLLNDTDAKRAAIVRRYRLMSGQPDEFIQFKALSEMAARPGLAKLDPRLYQYGGLWMYPVGAMVRASMLVGIIPTPPAGTPAMEFYLDHPEAFGRFYVVARFYSWCWGVVAALAIVWIARRVTGSTPLATLAAVAFMLTPVVRAATHEAKPHLAGAALCLCAVIAATRYVETGRRRWAVAAGALCGGAMAMVVSMLLSCVVLPVMVWLRWRTGRRPATPTAVRSDRTANDDSSWKNDLTAQRSAWSEARRSLVAPLFASLACAAVIYVATNPFVLINAVLHPEILRSNLGNSTAMYSARSDGLQAVTSAWRILIAGMTPLWLGFGATAFVIGVIGSIWRRRVPPNVVILMATIVAAFAAQFVLLAAGKPAEYARFALVVVAGLCVAIATVLPAPGRAVRGTSLVISVLIVLLGAVSMLYETLASEKRVARSVQRAVLAREIAMRERTTNRLAKVATRYEPAPWSAPAVDLFGTFIVLLPRDAALDEEAFDVTLSPTNLSSQISGDPSPESVDWRYNGYSIRWSELNSDSDSAGYRSASRTGPASRGR